MTNDAVKYLIFYNECAPATILGGYCGGRNLIKKEGAAISIIRLLIKSDSEYVERVKRYILSCFIGMLAGVFFIYAAKLLLLGASSLAKYVF